MPGRTLASRDVKSGHPSDRPFVAYESPEREALPPSSLTEWKATEEKSREYRLPEHPAERKERNTRTG